MYNRKENHISLKFIFFLLVIFSIIIYYISQPSGNQNVNKTKTFEEMLEYSNATSYPTKKDITEKELKNSVEIKNNRSTQQISKVYKNKEEVVTAKNTEADYNKILDIISQYPAKSIDSARNIVNRLLVYKGYPQNCIRVIPSDIDQSKSKTEGNYMVANFDFNTGNLYISSKMLYELDTKKLIAVLAHELDHFDKLAKICKYMGITEFEQLFKDNNIKYIDTSFWKRVATYANTENFNGKFYQEALTRFLTQNNLELTSSYSDFYRLSENMRNPLEISAYEESDYVYKYFNIEIKDGPMKVLTKTFNDVDWEIYNTISKNEYVKDERIAIFDYFFLEAILKTFPDLKTEYNICQNQKNGDLTYFWLTFENSVKSFYQKGKMDNNTYIKMLNLLKTTEEEVKKGITDNEIATALKYKINTLSSNLVYPNVLDNLKKTTISYLKYTKEKNIQDSEQELRSIITLINIENEIFTTSTNKNISLYYIKIPEILTKIYGIKEKKKFLVYIYNNEAFKAQKNSNQTEQELLQELIEKNILNIRIQKTNQ